MADDTFDIKKYALTDEKLAELEKKRSTRKKSRADDEHDVTSEVGIELEQERARKRAGQFIMMPMPWFDRLCSKPAHNSGTPLLALGLIRHQFERRKNTFVVSNVFAAQMKLTPKMKRLALRELTSLGLIKVDWRPRRSPVVTINLRYAPARRGG